MIRTGHEDRRCRERIAGTKVNLGHGRRACNAVDRSQLSHPGPVIPGTTSFHTFPMRTAEPRHAPWDTLPGRLQRGTGAGYLQALAADRRVARNALVAAIAHDWRWDRQLDSRGWYCACLADDLGLTSAAVEEVILTAAAGTPPGAIDAIAVHVLERLASFGDDSAARRLVDYVRYGPHIDIPISWCTSDGTDADLDRLLAALTARFPHQAAARRDSGFVEDTSASWLVALLESLAERDSRFDRFVRLLRPVLGRTAATVSERASGPEPKVRDATTFADGCRAFIDPDSPWPRESLRTARPAALEWLRARHGPGDADWLADFLLGDPPASDRGGVWLLGTLLPVADWPAFVRRACVSDREGTRSVAAHLLSLTEHPDADLVRLGLQAALAADDMYTAGTLLDVVFGSRLDAALPEVERAYREAIYSWGTRQRAVKVLHGLFPARFRDAYARECLWDCEPEIVEFGCRAADLDDLDVRPRLEFLRDAFEPEPDGEQPSVHELARDRLGY